MDEPNLRQSQDEMSLVDRLPWMNLRIQKVFLKLRIQEFMAAQDCHTLTLHSVTNTCLLTGKSHTLPMGRFLQL